MLGGSGGVKTDVPAGAALTIFSCVAQGPMCAPGSAPIRMPASSPPSSISPPRGGPSTGVGCSGTPSAPVPLVPGPTVIPVAVTARDGATTRTYDLTVTHGFAQEAYLKAVEVKPDLIVTEPGVG